MANRLRNSLIYAFVTVLGVMSVLIFGLAFAKALKVTSISGMGFYGVLITWLSMIPGFCLVPYAILKKKYKINPKDVGIARTSRKELIVILMISVTAFLYLFAARKDITLVLLFTVLLQNLGVALSEEFFSKGILLYLAGKITENKFMAVLLCACVFAFVFHGSGDPLINLTYRLPMGIILGLIYLKTDNICLPVILHLINNLVATSALN